MTANDHQVGGEHYKSEIQHWDFVASQGLDYFQGQITKYITRWKKKNGIDDLEKARHFLEKYIELERNKLREISTVAPNVYSKNIGMTNPFGYDEAEEHN